MSNSLLGNLFHNSQQASPANLQGMSATTMNALAQQAGMAQNQLSNAYNAGMQGTIGAANSQGSRNGVTTTDLDNPMFKAPLLVLRDIWSAKHGNKWVTIQEVSPIGDKDWHIIFERLKTNALEIVYLQDKGHQVYRLPPE